MGRIMVGGAVAVVLYDALASWASLAIGFPYGRAAIGSWVIYAVVGFLAGRANGIVAALVAGVVVGLVDASAGWAVSWAIGPGRMPGPLMPSAWLQVALWVGGMAGAIATVAGVAGHFSRPSAASAA